MMDNLQLGSFDFLDDRNIEVIFAFDGTKDPEKKFLQSHIIKEVKGKRFAFKYRVRVRKENLGVDIHIPLLIEETLTKSDAVIVMEDDILFSRNTLESIINLIVLQLAEQDIRPIVGMSGIPSKFNLLKILRHRWRTSIYFTAWGFALTRKFWEEHRSVTRDGWLRIELEDSKRWQMLRKRKQNLWLERFERGNYDYRVQLTLFAKEIDSIAPTFNMVSNLGFGVKNSTHTRFSKPWFLENFLCRVPNIDPKLPQESCLSIERFWKFIDSNTWAGDGLLSRRGRNIGVRSLVQRVKDFIQAPVR
jgi:hypothetical protein